MNSNKGKGSFFKKLLVFLLLIFLSQIIFGKDGGVITLFLKSLIIISSIFSNLLNNKIPEAMNQGNLAINSLLKVIIYGSFYYLLSLMIVKIINPKVKK